MCVCVCVVREILIVNTHFSLFIGSDHSTDNSTSGHYRLYNRDLSPKRS